ncbi:hypothetical protein GBAG_1003 [Buttiauxella agrestis ATCC 33320]|uniref:Uncharacterized protein n=1 Tax=Buttiauxella agrestis ATCC 33320 TaxID=1006004 RepID=A0A085GFZ6_9ENTR|nr:hypothetical protein GBAG_1003 [Buttiauxella agrestis ATCC 33320]
MDNCSGKAQQGENVICIRKMELTDNQNDEKKLIRLDGLKNNFNNL